MIVPERDPFTSLRIVNLNNSLVIKEYGKEHQIQVVNLILQIQQKDNNIPITKDDQPDLFAIEDFYQTGNGNFWTL